MTEIDPARYGEQLAAKTDRLQALLARHQPPALDIFPSAPLHFRMRAEFRIWHRDDRCHYAMMEPGSQRPRIIEDFPIGSAPMVNTMAPLLTALNANPELRRKLYQADFLTTLTGEVLVTLVYHRTLDCQWRNAALDLAAQLGIHLVGRSKKQKIVIGGDALEECLRVDDREYRYQQVEGSFTQPNAGLNEKMLGWAKAVSRDLGGDLLELYCGNGNFTVVLSDNFTQVLATEVTRTSVQSAHHNFALNGVDNVAIARMSSEELTAALNGERAFNRLKDIDLDSYQFSTIFVDPPRAGLDEETLKLASRFDNILYISCNPETLAANLDGLEGSHRIEQLALFDQFPYTQHIESGVLLKKK